MERRAHNMETITLRIRRAGTTELRRLDLYGHRLLAGHADTGIFCIAESEVPRATQQPTKPASRRDDDDGLATATIEITEPLALVEPSGRRAALPRQR
jgi:hypothetical protein